MIDDDKLAHLRIAYWMRGYARCMDESGKSDCDVLVNQLRRASDMLEAVWDEYHASKPKKPVIEAVTGKQYEPMEFTEFWGAK